MADRVRIGELLVETGLISRAQLDHVLKLQEGDPRRLGELVVDEGFVSESKVTQIVSQQLSVPWVSLEYIDFSRQLLNLVTREIAEKYSVIPIYVRRSKNRQETLYVAMEDPSDSRPLDEIEQHAGLPVRPMIAPPSDIRAAIRAYYLGLPPEPAHIPSIPPEHVAALKSSLPAPPSTPALEVSVPRDTGLNALVSSGAGLDTSVASGAGTGVPVPFTPGEFPATSADNPSHAEALPAEEEPAPVSDAIESRDSKMPAPKRASDEQPEMLTLTMLDGTTLRLPASRKAGTTKAPGELTARDLVEALRAHAAGQDMSQVFGKDVNWERMFAALLSLLLQKHLILDWEFVRELKR